MTIQNVKPARKVDIRPPGKGNSNSHGTRPVHQIIWMIKWIRTSRLSIKNSVSLHLQPARKVAIRPPGKENSNFHGARPVHQIIWMMKWIRTSRLSMKNSRFSLHLPSPKLNLAQEISQKSAHVARISRRDVPLPLERASGHFEASCLRGRIVWNGSVRGDTHFESEWVLI